MGHFYKEGYMMSKVVLYQTNKMYYFQEGSFRPSKKYPEYVFSEISASENFIYDAVRESFFMMGLDAEHYGMKEWNPLSEFIKSGDIVLIKPNMVMHINASGEGEECLYTQPSVVAPVVDYVIKALKKIKFRKKIYMYLAFGGMVARKIGNIY